MPNLIIACNGVSCCLANRAGVAFLRGGNRAISPQPNHKTIVYFVLSHSTAETYTPRINTAHSLVIIVYNICMIIERGRWCESTYSTDIHLCQNNITQKNAKLIAFDVCVVLLIYWRVCALWMPETILFYLFLFSDTMKMMTKSM